VCWRLLLLGRLRADACGAQEPEKQFALVELHIHGIWQQVVFATSEIIVMVDERDHLCRSLALSLSRPFRSLSTLKTHTIHLLRT